MARKRDKLGQVRLIKLGKTWTHPYIHASLPTLPSFLWKEKVLGENKSVFAINTSSKFGNAWKNRDQRSPISSFTFVTWESYSGFPTLQWLHQTWDPSNMRNMLAFDGHFVLFPLFHYETFRWAFLCKVSSGKRENGKNERMKQRFLSAKDPPQSIPGA